jgi:hypothetical protein
MTDKLDKWRCGDLRWRVVWVRKDGSLVVAMNRYAAQSHHGYDPQKAYERAAGSRPFFDDWTGQTIVVQQANPWSDEEAKELARRVLAERGS